MNINQYITASINELRAFGRFWERAHAEDPELFPWEMEAGDWDEQLRIFLDCHMPDSRGVGFLPEDQSDR